MENNLRRQLIMLSKRLVYAFLFQLFLCTVLLANTGNAQRKSIKEVKVSLNLTEQSLSHFFKQVESKTDFKFTYTDNLVDLKQSITVVEKNKSLYDVLVAVSMQTQLNFVQVNENIHVKVQKGNLEDEAVEVVQKADVNVRGIVKDETGEPIPGVTVLVRGTTIGTVTELDGSYTLTAPEESTLVFSFVGFVAQAINVGNQSIIDVTLKEDATSLEEVVVVGYGVQAKKSLTGAVSTVNSEELNAVATGDATSRLQGRVAGVTVIGNNDPSSQATIRVRGYGSLGNNNPLFVIDGIPRTSMDNINPNDIESMTVLKDASSSAIYGSRAANGVIVITTKTGKEGKTTLSFDVRTGMQYKTNRPDLMNSEEIGLNLWQKYKNMGLVQGGTGWGDAQYGYGASPVVPDYIFPAGQMLGAVDENTYSWPVPYNAITKANKGETDWYEAIFKPAPIQDYNLSVTGGNSGSIYSISMGYQHQEGILNFKGDERNGPTNNGFERYSLRSNAEFKVNEWLKIGSRISGTYTNRSGLAGAGPADGVLTLHPILPIYDIRGNFAGSKTPSTGNGTNQVANLIRSKDNYDRQIILQASPYVQANITKEFIFKSMLGVSYNSGMNMSRFLVDPEFNQTSLVSRLNVQGNFGLLYNWVNTLNYLKKIKDYHNFNVLLGAESLDNRTEYVAGARSTFAFTDLDYMVLNAGERDITNSGNFDQSRLFSYFGRFNYDYKGKFLLEGVVRRDGSSRFLDNYRWGTFPAFSAGWRIIEEPFMSNINWLDDLKIRVGWGKNGNDNVGNYNAYSTFVANGMESYYNISGSSRHSSAAGFHQSTLGNVFGRWETNVATNVGLDLSMFESKFQVTLDLYNRVTTDMLYNDARPATWGQVFLPNINIGEMKNTGVDLSMTFRDQPGKNFSYAINANLSHFKNEVVKLNNNPLEQRFGNPVEASFNTITKAGKPLNTFYGYIVDGIFNTAEEVSNWPKFNPNLAGNDVYSQPGVFKYRDVNGDGIINHLDRTFIGDGYPDLTYGFNIDLKFKNWDMSTFFQGVVGRDIINNAKRNILFIRQDGNYLRQRLYESWTPERYANGEIITLPITINNDSNMSLPNSFFVEDGDYLRIKNIQIGYTIPPNVLHKIKFQGLRAYIQVSNLFTFTNYSGLDVEVNETGIDSNVYPTPRVIMFGFNVKL